jgi:hypothetical protein
MVEGYAPSQRHDVNSGEDVESQIVVSLEKDPSLSLTKVSVVISYLSIAALTEPLREAVEFFNCEWSVQTSAPIHQEETIPLHTCEEPVQNVSSGSAPEEGASALQLRFVLHYPRLILVADEHDRHSRALVLEG